MVQRTFFVCHKDLQHERSGLALTSLSKKKWNPFHYLLTGKSPGNQLLNQRIDQLPSSASTVGRRIACEAALLLSPRGLSWKAPEGRQAEDLAHKGNNAMEWFFANGDLSSEELHFLTGASSDIYKTSKDLKSYIMYAACGRNADGIQSAAALCIALDIQLDLHRHDFVWNA